MASKWEEHAIEAKLLEILRDAVPPEPDHAFGRSYLTAYQLAIEFAARYPEAFTALGLPIGGAGTGQRNSLPQYLALELSRRIGGGHITQIEGAFLSNLHVRELVFNQDGETLRSSLVGTTYALSMFRLAE